MLTWNAVCSLFAFKRYSTVEHRFFRCTVGVYIEVAYALELEMAQMWQVGSPFFNVGIVVYTQNSNSSAGEGTGVIMGEDKTGTYTYIITCAHVISDAGIKARIQLHDGTTFDAEIVGFDTRTDLGVLRIKAKGLPVETDAITIEEAAKDILAALKAHKKG